MPPYDGRDVWFAFSFRVEGDIPQVGSSRTVIGQWKAPGDVSPYVAQRFDNGVFHITVQDNETRRVIASAEGDPDRLRAVQQVPAHLSPDDLQVINGITSLQSLYQLQRSQPNLTTNLFSGDLVGALNDKNVGNPLSNQLSKLLNLPSGALVPHFQELAYVSEPERYLGPADLEITPEKDAKLPDPKQGWVDMVYRIKGGRTDNEVGPREKGEVEVWANGKKIVSVRGNIGHTLKEGTDVDLLGPFFKFGLYRAFAPGEVRFHFDEFSQAAKRSELMDVCSK